MKKEKGMSWTDARDLLLAHSEPTGTENVPLEQCTGRVLAQPLIAKDNVPPFDRSPYDGYAFRCADVAGASRECPVILKILEEIPAGGTSHIPVTEGTAVKVLTGAPIPEGADAVVMFEKTDFTVETVTIYGPAKPGDNIVLTGEDVRKGDVLARAGTVIDAGLLGTLASQNIAQPLVYRRPVVGIISTGSELVEVGEDLAPGMIYNTNRYTLTAALEKLGCRPVYLGTGRDSEKEIADLLEKGLLSCDAVILTGGVSVGDYDLTPAAMEACGVSFLFRHVDLKPGMACAYGIRDGKLVMGLSGNPASSITNFYAIALPALRRICGLNIVLPQEVELTLLGGFRKASRGTRMLRGRLTFDGGCLCMSLPADQGNVVLSSTIGCNVMAVVPAGSGPIAAGTKLKGFLL